MRNFFLVCRVLTVSLFFAGCDYTDGLLKDGEVVRNEINVEAFDKIVLETSVFLVLDNDTSYSVVAEGADFILSRLEVTQDENVLTVESPGLFGFRKKKMPVLTVSAPGLNHIRSNSPVQIGNIDTLRVQDMNIVISGRGSFTECNLTVEAESLSLGAYGSNVGNHILKGRVNSLRITSIGLTSVDAGELVAKNVVYDQRSVNPGHVNAVDNLTVKMLSSGNLYYFGSPDTTVEMGTLLYDLTMGQIIQLSE